LSETISDVGKGKNPVWRFVSSKDLTMSVKPDARDAAAALLDGEVGVLFYLLPFSLDIPMRSQVVRALALRSQLAIERNYAASPTEQIDQNGAWRVVINWLVSGTEQKNDWIEQIAELRRETAFSEEVALDAIFFTNGNIDKTLTCHGFPHLLLTTREVLKKSRYEEMDQWLSADSLVRQAIKGFASNFHITAHRKLASQVERAMEKFPRKSSREALRNASTPASLRAIRVRNFRNLGDVRLEFGTDPVTALVVHGPNGSGKSSLCEALSIGLFGSSYRYRRFADRTRELDVRGSDRVSTYINRYLSPLESDAKPQIAINGGSLSSPSLVDVEHIEEADLRMAGTVLTQDTTLEFTRMPSDDLNARVLRGYSDLADYVEEFVHGRIAQAEAARHDLLHRFGLTASIKKIDTAFDRIAKRELDRTLPPIPHNLITWLTQLDQSDSASTAADLISRWTACGDQSRNSDTPAAIAAAGENVEEIQRILREWLQTTMI
jgi:energy-coupling factor transporter ATP-binding protein EcfA2